MAHEARGLEQARPLGVCLGKQRGRVLFGLRACAFDCRHVGSGAPARSLERGVRLLPCRRKRGTSAATKLTIMGVSRYTGCTSENAFSRPRRRGNATVRDLVLNGPEPLKAVLTLSTEFLTDQTTDYVLGGRFTVLG